MCLIKASGIMVCLCSDTFTHSTGRLMKCVGSRTFLPLRFYTHVPDPACTLFGQFKADVLAQAHLKVLVRQQTTSVGGPTAAGFSSDPAGMR